VPYGRSFMCAARSHLRQKGGWGLVWSVVSQEMDLPRALVWNRFFSYVYGTKQKREMGKAVNCFQLAGLLNTCCICWLMLWKRQQMVMFCICQSNYRINQPTPTFTSNSPNLFIISGIGVAYRNLLYLLKSVYLLRVIKLCCSR